MYSFEQSPFEIPFGEPKTKNLEIGKLWQTTNKKNIQYHAKLFSIWSEYFSRAQSSVKQMRMVLVSEVLFLSLPLFLSFP